jgi:hypothetical protein
MCAALEGSLTDARLNVRLNARLLEALGRELAAVDLELRQMVDRAVPRFI